MSAASLKEPGSAEGLPWYARIACPSRIPGTLLTAGKAWVATVHKVVAEHQSEVSGILQDEMDESKRDRSHVGNNIVYFTVLSDRLSGSLVGKNGNLG